ncbi:hypothetical protein B7494_g1080 [Chlorociboria aeruginascens]|nr:hypothetical protein B7494_g1080 [Chlorociboria aeruginascens]
MERPVLSPPRYSEIEFAPSPSASHSGTDVKSAGEKGTDEKKVPGKIEEKIEEKDFTVAIRNLDDSNTGSDSDVERTKPSEKLGSRLRRWINTISVWSMEWGPFTLLATYFITSVFMYTVLPEGVLEIFWFLYMTTNFYIAANTVIEACLALTPNAQARKAMQKMEETGWNFPTSNEDLPTIDIVIVAYLPNEKDIIIDRVLYAINQLVYPSHKLTINIVYNTPIPMRELQMELHDLAAKHANLRVMQVPGSKSKADNVNFFLSLNIQTDVIAIFDCDHYPHPYGPRWAAERFCQDSKIGVVQGRCVVFNASTSFLTQMIAVEFDKIYAVSHPGRAEMWDFGLFCGSNGYWKADILRDIGMDDDMLTEDIDSALRALAKNVNVIHEINAISFELAPTTYTGLWKQRLRWAQGWTQASVKHAVLAWKKPEEGNRKFSVRAGLVSLLLVRELSYYLVSQYFCLVICFIIVGFPKNPVALAKLVFFKFPVSEWFFIISIVCLFATLFITNHVRSEFVTRRTVVKFTIIYPAYLMINAAVGLYGHARQIMGYSSWNPTART